MPDDLVQWAQGGAEKPPVSDLLAVAEILPGVPDPRLKKSRHRPNNGRKRVFIGPLLETPPWGILEETGYPIPRDIGCLPRVPRSWRSGPKATRWKREAYAMWGRTCHICGHGNADSIDHLVPLSVWGNQPYDPRISRPAHGVAGCPTCHVKCNSSRGNRLLGNAIRDYKPAIAL